MVITELQQPYEHALGLVNQNHGSHIRPAVKCILSTRSRDAAVGRFNTDSNATTSISGDDGRDASLQSATFLPS